MELTGYLAVARRWWWTLLVATWVAGLAGLLVATRITPTYEAQVQMLVGPINTDSDTLKASGLLVQTYAQLAISSPLLQSTAQEVGGLDATKLGQNVRATANDATRVLTIRVQDADPGRAARIANTMSDELIQLTTGATTRPEGQLEVIGAAVPPTTPIAPQISLIVLLAMAAGLIGGLVLVIVVEYATDTIRDRSDLARLSGTEVLATIAFDSRNPGVSPLPVPEAVAPNSPNAIAFRLLASMVAFSEHDTPTRTILVAGIGDGDSGVIAAGIAAAVAGSGQRALLIDGSPEGDITASFGLSGRPGLRDVASREAIEPRAILVDGPAGMKLLPRGETGSAELIAVDRADEILANLLGEVELIVIDGGAMLRSAGALSWARLAQQTILLVRRGTSRREDVRLAVESLRFVNASIGGSVLIQRAPGRALRRGGARAASIPLAAAPLAPDIRSRLDSLVPSGPAMPGAVAPALDRSAATRPDEPALVEPAERLARATRRRVDADDAAIGTLGAEPTSRPVRTRSPRAAVQATGAPPPVGAVANEPAGAAPSERSPIRRADARETFGNPASVQPAGDGPRAARAPGRRAPAD